MRRVVIFGGTFDPIHEGHLHIIRTVRHKVSCDAFWLMPAAQPAHRLTPPLLDAKTRLQCCEAAVATLSGVEVSRIEFDLPFPSYTIQTLRYLHQHYPETRFVWILGMDAWKGLAGWHDWRELFELTDWLIVDRPNYVDCPDDPFLLKRWNERSQIEQGWHDDAPIGQVYTLELSLHPASATKIREAIRLNTIDQVYAWMPEAVWHIVRDRLQ
jgi:nicotinate-nucleotide adenylyltransferase